MGSTTLTGRNMSHSLQDIRLSPRENSPLSDENTVQPKESQTAGQSLSHEEVVNRHEDSGLRFPNTLDLPPAYHPT